MLLLDPELAEERQNEIVTRARELVERGGGTWVAHEAWGRRRLAYEIEKRTDGFYHLLHFDAEPATLDELTRVLKITDGALRHMAVRRPATRSAPKPPPETGAAPEPSAETSAAPEPAAATPE